MTDWHRLFGLVLIDLFTNSPFKVELELDLSTRKQLLDVVVVRKDKGEFSGKLPDGLEDLSKHNLITYKSLREPLDSWALEELIGYFVNYRKQVVEEREALPPSESFRLYAVSTRFPKKLSSEVELVPKSKGIYQTCFGVRDIKVIVLKDIPQEKHNALWNIFSADKQSGVYGSRHYEKRSKDISTVLDQIFTRYRMEGIDMPYTMENFKHDVAKEYLPLLTPSERLEGLSDDDLKELPIDKRLKGLSPSEVVKSLPADEIAKNLPTEVRLKGMSIEEIKTYLKQLESNPSENDKD